MAKWKVNKGPRGSRSAHRIALHLDRGLAAFEDEDVAGVDEHLRALEKLGLDAHAPQVAALAWRSRWLADRPDEALDIARDAAGRDPSDADAALDLASLLTHGGRDAEARDVLRAAAAHRPDDVELWYELALAAEALEDEVTRHDAFVRVWELEHEAPPAPGLELSEAAFLDVAEAALADLPAAARRAIGNVAVIVEDYPERWLLETEVGDPRLLGLFDGPDRALEHSTDHVSTGPARIYLFRWNIERVSRDADEVAEQIVITVRHEVGHYLGLDEDALDARGLG